MSTPTPRSITAADLRTLLTEHPDTNLLDVLPPESFAAEHLPSAVNACVYQTDFLAQVDDLVPDKTHRIVVYDLDVNSHASSAAAEQLAAADYPNVLDFSGGLAAWKTLDQPIEGNGEPAPSAALPESRTYIVDPEESLLEWTGRNLVNRHHGTIRVANGSIHVENAAAKNGTIVLDLETITCTDIPDATQATMLAGHLKSADFFDVDTYPTATFTLREITPIPDATPGIPNHTVHGTLALRGVEQPVTFPAAINLGPDNQLVAQATFEIDRTRWNVIYGSGKLFARLGKHLVNDLVALHLKIVAR